MKIKNLKKGMICVEKPYLIFIVKIENFCDNEMCNLFYLDLTTNGSRMELYKSGYNKESDVNSQFSFIYRGDKF